MSSSLAAWGRGCSAAFALLALATAACQRAPGHQRIIGPDGSPMSHVHCGADQGSCFRIAGDLCPGGYELKPVLSSNDGNYLVRCRDTQAPVLAAAATQGGERFPHSKDTWPLIYPWPPAEPTAGVDSASKPAPAQDVDLLGY